MSKKVLHFISILLALAIFNSTILVSANTPSESFSDLDSESRVGGSGIGYKEEFLTSVLTDSGAFLCWHPDFPNYTRNVSMYYFLSSKASMNISLGGEYVSISYSPASNITGTGVAADPSRASRPAIHGDIYIDSYQAGYYNFNTNTWQSSSVIHKTAVRDTYIEVHYA